MRRQEIITFQRQEQNKQKTFKNKFNTTLNWLLRLHFKRMNMNIPFSFQRFFQSFHFQFFLSVYLPCRLSSMSSIFHVLRRHVLRRHVDDQDGQVYLRVDDGVRHHVGGEDEDLTPTHSNNHHLCYCTINKNSNGWLCIHTARRRRHVLI